MIITDHNNNNNNNGKEIPITVGPGAVPAPSGCSSGLALSRGLRLYLKEVPKS